MELLCRVTEYYGNFFHNVLDNRDVIYHFLGKTQWVWTRFFTQLCHCEGHQMDNFAHTHTLKCSGESLENALNVLFKKLFQENVLISSILWQCFEISIVTVNEINIYHFLFYLKIFVF